MWTIPTSEELSGIVAPMSLSTQSVVSVTEQILQKFQIPRNPGGTEALPFFSAHALKPGNKASTGQVWTQMAPCFKWPDHASSTPWIFKKITDCWKQRINNLPWFLTFMAFILWLTQRQSLNARYDGWFQAFWLLYFSDVQFTQGGGILFCAYT